MQEDAAVHARSLQAANAELKAQRLKVCHKCMRVCLSVNTCCSRYAMMECMSVSKHLSEVTPECISGLQSHCCWRLSHVAYCITLVYVVRS